MNLWWRLFWFLLTAGRRPSIAPDGLSVLRFRVWPGDLDISSHMNNGRYVTIADFGRMDVMARSGLWRLVRERGWTPIASNVSIRFRREMRMWQRFMLESQIVAWDAEQVIFQHRFVLKGGPKSGQTAALALVKAGIYDRAARRFVPISEMMDALGSHRETPPMSDEIRAFLDTDSALRALS